MIFHHYSYMMIFQNRSFIRELTQGLLDCVLRLENTERDLARLTAETFVTVDETDDVFVNGAGAMGFNPGNPRHHSTPADPLYGNRPGDEPPIPPRHQRPVRQATAAHGARSKTVAVATTTTTATTTTRTSAYVTAHNTPV